MISTSCVSGFNTSPQLIQSKLFKKHQKDSTLIDSASPNLSVNKVKFSASNANSNQKRVNKWDAAKKGATTGLYLGLPLGLAALSYNYLPKHLLPFLSKGTSKNLLVQVLERGLFGMFIWAIQGAVIGAIAASRVNHKLKQKKLPSDSDQSPRNIITPQKAFIWGVGVDAIYALASWGFIIGTLGRKSKKAILKTPLFLIPTIGISLASSVASGYVASKTVSWINQGLGLPSKSQQART